MAELKENPVYIEHLSRIVQFPTLSTPNDAATDWAPFEGLHVYLEETYPLIHSKMEKTVIGHGSLLFHLKAKEEKKRPVLIMAHQDVVPVGDETKWTYPPFSGTVADGRIWGRGSIDCKVLLMSEMEAVESLLAEGFAPDYDLYIALGHNEEVGADKDVKGSKLTAAYLADKGVSLGCLFDEGGKVFCGADEGGTRDYAQVSLGEKASVDFVLYKDGKGGHAMKPGSGTLLGSVARAVAALEAHPMPYRLIPLTRAQLLRLSEMKTGAEKEIYADPDAHWDELSALARADKQLDALLHTTFAVTMASASSQSNVLPTHAEATVNTRILQGETIESVMAYIKSVIPEDVEVKCLEDEGPRPVGSVESCEFKLLERVIHEQYGEDTLVVPSLLLGGTDSRNYTGVCENVFKFGGGYHTKGYGETHQIDERIPTNVLGMSVEFFRRFLRAYEED